MPFNQQVVAVTEFVLEQKRKNICLVSRVLTQGKTTTFLQDNNSRTVLGPKVSPSMKVIRSVHVYSINRYTHIEYKKPTNTFFFSWRFMRHSTHVFRNPVVPASWRLTSLVSLSNNNIKSRCSRWSLVSVRPPLLFHCCSQVSWRTKTSSWSLLPTPSSLSSDPLCRNGNLNPVMWHSQVSSST